MKNVITAAIVSALVATASTAAATSWINGHSIRPHSIPADRLTKGARVSLQGPQGPKGDPGIEGQNGRDGSGITDVAFFPAACGNGGWAVSYGPPNLNGNPSGNFIVCNGATGPQGPQGPQGLGNSVLTICLAAGGTITQAPCAQGDTPVRVVIVS